MNKVIGNTTYLNRMRTLSGQQKNGYMDVYPTKWYVSVLSASFLLRRSYLNQSELSVKFSKSYHDIASVNFKSQLEANAKPLRIVM